MAGQIKVTYTVLLFVCIYRVNCSFPKADFWVDSSNDVIKVECDFDRCGSTDGLVSVSLHNVSSGIKKDLIDVYKNWNKDVNPIVMNYTINMEEAILTIWIGSEYVGNELVCLDMKSGSNSSVVLKYNKGEPEPVNVTTVEVGAISTTLTTSTVLPTSSPPCSDADVNDQQNNSEAMNNNSMV